MNILPIDTTALHLPMNSMGWVAASVCLRPYTVTGFHRSYSASE